MVDTRSFHSHYTQYGIMAAAAFLLMMAVAVLFGLVQAAVQTHDRNNCPTIPYLCVLAPHGEFRHTTPRNTLTIATTASQPWWWYCHPGIDSGCVVGYT